MTICDLEIKNNIKFKDYALEVIKIEAEAVKNLENSIDDNFVKSCDLILNCKGKVIVTGLGKSGHIARKIAASLASTGTSAFFIHPTEANHGDLGMIDKNDLVIAISNSGSGEEIINILKTIKAIFVPSISITNNPNSKIAKLCDYHININISKEACNLGLAPTTSTTATLVIGDALTIAVSQAKKFTVNDFAKTHPSGKLGKKLTKIEDIMFTGDNIPKINKNKKINEAILEMTNKKLGLTTITDNTEKNKNKDKIIGIFTDGDLRRVVEDKINLYSTLINEVMTKNFKSISRDKLAIDALNIMEKNKILSLAVIDNSDNLIGIVTMHQLISFGIL